MRKISPKILLIQTLGVFFILYFFIGMQKTAAAENIIYVDNTAQNCSDGATDYDPATKTCGNGTHKMYTNIQVAVSNISQGATVNIRGGTYYLSSPIIMRNSSELTSAVKNYNAEAVALDCGNISQRAILFSGSVDADNVTLKGLEIKNCTGEGIHVNTKDNITLDNITVHDNDYPGVWLQSVTNSIIQNSTFYNNIASGIWVQGDSTDILIQNNTLRNNLINPGGGGSGDGIDIFNDQTQTSTTFNERIKILNNNIYENEKQGIKTARTKHLLIKGNMIWLNGKTGIQIESNTQHVILDSNTLHDNSSYSSNEIGWWLDEVWYGYVKNNISYNNYTGGGTSQSWYTSAHHNVHYNNKGQRFADPKTSSRTLYLSDGQNSNAARYTAPSPPGSQYNYFANNTSYGDGSSDTAIGGFIVIDNPPWDGPNNDPILNNIFINNIIANRGGANGYEIKIGNGNVNAVDLDYNLYYNAENTNRWLWTNTQTSFSFYQAESSQDAHSINENPLFTNADTNDFTLQLNSPARDKGKFVTATAGAGVGSKILTVQDAYWFTDGSDGNGGYLDTGDVIQLKGQSARATILAIDYSAKILTLDTALTWSDGQMVAFAYVGSSPDIGAFEYGEAMNNPADINSDTRVNIKDIQACIHVITGSDLTYIDQCRVLAPPPEVTNIKDIQVIIHCILDPQCSNPST